MQSCTFGRRACLLQPKGLTSRPALKPELRVQALFTKKGKKAQPEAPPKKKQSVLSQFTDALDFSQTRSEGDRDLLDAAKGSVGKRSKNPKGQKDGREKDKMSPEQYQALRRKVGGTARDYWKDFIQADEVEGYKSGAGANVQGLPFLLVVVLGVVIATAVVVSQTGNPTPPTEAPAKEQTLPKGAQLSES